MNLKNNKVKKQNQSKFRVKIVQKLWIYQFHLHIHNRNNTNKFLQNNLLSKEDQKIAYIRRKSLF